MVASPAPGRRPPIPFELLNNRATDVDAWNTAWRAVISEYTPMVRRYVKRVAVGADWDEVEDIIAETWSSAEQNLRGLRNVDAFERWVRTIAKSRWLQHIRQTKSMSHVDDPGDLELLAYPDPRPLVDAKLAARDIYDQVYERLDNPEHQAYLNKKIIEGLTHAELAKLRNTTEVGSKKFWNRLKKRIESILRDIGVDGYDAS